MNNQEIVNYVMHTPGNTNPTILKQMLNEGFSWDNLANKPFDEMVVMGDTASWDGNPEGRVVITDFLGTDPYLVKVSDMVPKIEDLINGVFSIDVAPDGNEVELFADFSMMHEEENFIAVGDTCVIFKQAAKEIWNIEPGTYVLYSPRNGAYVKSIRIPGYKGFASTVIIPLDEKFMPVLTSPNGKKFKLTVSDNGVISTIEI